MRRPSVSYVLYGLIAALTLVVSTQVPGLAQHPPDLSGKWVFVPGKSTGTPTIPRIYNTTGAPAASDELVITQTQAAVNITVGGVDLIYRLDGTEGNVSADGRAGFPVGNATWEDQELMVSLTQEVFATAKMDYVKVPVHESYSVSGGMLIVKRTRTHLDGTTTSEELVYTKAS